MVVGVGWARLAPGWSTGESPPRKSASGNVDVGGVAFEPACAASVRSVVGWEPDCAESLLVVVGGESGIADAAAGSVMHEAATIAARTWRVLMNVMRGLPSGG
jgi:hypothetical protein